MKNFKSLLVLSAISALTAGCATYSPDQVYAHQAQTLQAVQFATVLSIRPVSIEGQSTGLGALSGGIAGAALAGGHGGSGVARGVLGAVAGGVLGNTIEKAAGKGNALEYTLQMADGSQRVFVQAAGYQEIRPGDQVRITGTHGQQRLSR